MGRLGLGDCMGRLLDPSQGPKSTLLSLGASA